MSDNPGLSRERLVVCFGGFIQGIGLSVEEARQIVKRAIAEDLAAAPADIEAKAHARMSIALA